MSRNSIISVPAKHPKMRYLNGCSVNDITDKVLLSIIIVSYNVRDFLWQALNSIEKAASGLSSEVIVVDNASYDGSVALVKKHFPRVKVIENKTNVGFARANNQALRICKGKFICLVNPDTLVQEDTFSTILKFFQEQPDAGMVGCKVLNPNGTLQLACRRSYPTPWIAFTRISGLSRLFPKSRFFGRYNLTYLHPEQVAEVEAISGSFMIVRRRVVDEVGLLDESFFLYGEDLDWCYRIREADWKIYYLPTTQIIHFKGESSRRSEFDQLRLFYKAMRLFVRKHFGKGRALVPSFFLQTAIWVRAGLHFFGAVISRIVLPLWDLLLINAALPLALWIRFGNLSNWRAFLVVWISYSLIWLFCLSAFGLYSRKRFSAARTLGAAFLGLILNSCLTFFFNQYAFSRAVVLIAGATNMLTLPGWRFLAKLLSRLGFGPFKGTLGRTLLRERSVIVGDLRSAEDLMRKLNGRVDGPYDVRGIVTTEAAVPDELSSRVLGTIDSLDRIVAQQRIHEVIFSTERMSYDKILHIISHVRRPGLYFKLVPSNLEVIVGKSSIERLDDIPLLDIDYKLHSQGYQFLKRTTDIVFSTMGLLVSLPILFYVRFINGKKPYTFSVYGLYNKPARIMSFAELDKEQPWWMKLPMLVGVLRGELSLVGKEIVQTGQEISSNDSVSFELKPGLTGLAQINSTPTMTEEDKQRYNLYYMKNYSPLLDLEIILKRLFKL